jgi:hypothetical protein
MGSRAPLDSLRRARTLGRHHGYTLRLPTLRDTYDEGSGFAGEDAVSVVSDSTELLCMRRVPEPRSPAGMAYPALPFRSQPRPWEFADAAQLAGLWWPAVAYHPHAVADPTATPRFREGHRPPPQQQQHDASLERIATLMAQLRAGIEGAAAVRTDDGATLPL